MMESQICSRKGSKESREQSWKYIHIYFIMDKSFRTHILHKLDDLVHGGVAGDPLVDVGDNIHADVAEDVLGLLGLASLGGGGEDEEGEGDSDHAELG